MRKIAVIILVLFLISSVSLFAAEGPRGQTKASAPEREKPLFQIASDTMEKKVEISDKDKVRLPKKIDVFQNLHDYLKEAGANAKDHSLRGKGKTYKPEFLD